MLNPNEIAKSLLKDRSKQAISRWVDEFHKCGIDLRLYIEEAKNQPNPANWYMTWLLTHYIETDQITGNTYQQDIWNFLSETTNHSMLRDLWRCMSHIEVIEEISGEVYDKAIKTFTSQKFPIAVRAHAMETAARIAEPFPELRNEMLEIMKSIEAHESAGIKSKIRNWRKAFA